ncbi:MAG TPA: L,D-transpeptidase [Candidatus Binataceae bacterium]|nr:L,D-transpeptidase [Candidatus Binataceae bacterium]
MMRVVRGCGLAVMITCAWALAATIVGAESPTAVATPNLTMAAIVPPSGAQGGLAPTSSSAADAHSDTKLAQRLFDQTPADLRADPFNWAIHIYKGRHRLEVYYKNQLFRTYHAVFGRGQLAGGKQWEGDSRTPEGAYAIVAKRRSRFDWFLKLNYPNGADQARFADLRANHQMPTWRREGGLVGIHGTDSPVLNNREVNWTLGCISVNNPDIEEMARLLPIGTVVIIKP